MGDRVDYSVNRSPGVHTCCRQPPARETTRRTTIVMRIEQNSPSPDGANPLRTSAHSAQSYGSSLGSWQWWSLSSKWYLSFGHVHSYCCAKRKALH